MPKGILAGCTNLLQLFICDYKDLSRQFKEYDVTYEKENGDPDEYELPKGKLIVMLLETFVDDMQINSVWTTVRRYTPEKYAYYQSIVGEEVQIIIK